MGVGGVGTGLRGDRRDGGRMKREDGRSKSRIKWDDRRGRDGAEGEERMDRSRIKWQGRGIRVRRQRSNLLFSPLNPLEFLPQPVILCCSVSPGQ